MFDKDELLIIGSDKKEIMDKHAMPSGSSLGQNKYRIIKTLGRSSMTFTYLAKAMGDEGLFIVKEFFPKTSARKDLGKSGLSRQENLQITLGDFPSETFTAMKTNYINQTDVLVQTKVCGHLVDVMGGFEEYGTAYRVSAYLAYPSLDKFLSEKLLTPQEALELYKSILKVVKGLHNLGYGHQDLKPQSIFITEHGVVLSDFSGQDAMSHHGHKYAPEKGHKLNAVGVDIYSLSVILEEILEIIGYKKNAGHDLTMGRTFDHIPMAYYLEETSKVDGTSMVKSLEGCIRIMSPLKVRSKHHGISGRFILGLALVFLTGLMVYITLYKKADDASSSGIASGEVTLVREASYRMYDFNHALTYKLPLSSSGQYKIELTHEETQRTLNFSKDKRGLDLKVLSLNPGSYCLKINNDFFESFHIAKPVNTHDGPTFIYDTYAYYLEEDQWISWKGPRQEKYNLKIVDAKNGDLVYHMVLEDSTLNLRDLSLKLGVYDLSLSQGQGEDASVYAYSQLSLHRQQALKSPMIYGVDPLGMQKDAVIRWTPVEGDMYLKWVSREDAQVYEGQSDGRGSFALASLDLKPGAYDLYVHRMDKSQRSAMIKKQVIIENP